MANVSREPDAASRQEGVRATVRVFGDSWPELHAAGVSEFQKLFADEWRLVSAEIERASEHSRHGKRWRGDLLAEFTGTSPADTGS